MAEHKRHFAVVSGDARDAHRPYSGAREALARLLSGQYADQLPQIHTSAVDNGATALNMPACSGLAMYDFRLTYDIVHTASRMQETISLAIKFFAADLTAMHDSLSLLLQSFGEPGVCGKAYRVIFRLYALQNLRGKQANLIGHHG